MKTGTQHSVQVRRPVRSILIPRHVRLFKHCSREYVCTLQGWHVLIGVDRCRVVLGRVGQLRPYQTFGFSPIGTGNP